MDSVNSSQLQDLNVVYSLILMASVKNAQQDCTLILLTKTVSISRYLAVCKRMEIFAKIVPKIINLSMDFVHLKSADVFNIQNQQLIMYAQNVILALTCQKENVSLQLQSPNQSQIVKYFSSMVAQNVTKVMILRKLANALLKEFLDVWTTQAKQNANFARITFTSFTKACVTHWDALK